MVTKKQTKARPSLKEKKTTQKQTIQQICNIANLASY
jgi:hypothetical protein